MSKVLIVGADGQLAYDLIRVFGQEHQVIEARRRDFDVRDEMSVQRFIEKARPEVVINTAAFHKTEECERNPELSFSVNAIGAFNIARSSCLVGASTVYISTGYVFDGGRKAYVESNCPNPVNVYGASKLSGEQLTSIASSKSYIIRTNGLFGYKRSGKGHNFVSLMLEKAKAGEEIKVVDDEYCSLTCTRDLAHIIKELIERKVPFGIYHLANSGGNSWYKMAEVIFQLAGIKAKISPISSYEKASIIKRPKHSVLATEKLSRLGIRELRSWKSAVRDYLREGVL